MYTTRKYRGYFQVKKKLCILMVAILFISETCADAEEVWSSKPRHAVVADCAWTSNIKENNDFKDKLSGMYFGKYLYFWMKIEGDMAALEYVKNTKRFPIGFSWYYYRYNLYTYDYRDKFVEIADDEIAELEEDCRAKGSWTYRIWDYRFKSADWVVVPIYPDGVKAECKSTELHCQEAISYKWR